MPSRPRSRWLVTLVLAATSIGSAITAAQLLSNDKGTPPNETLHVVTGDILEILPIHSFPSATYSWILTQDRNFLEVGRHAFYSTRLINPGRFTLNVEVSTPTETVLRRIFTIEVQPQQSPAPPSADIPTDPENPITIPLVRTVPEKRDDGLIILPPNQALLLLTPLRNDVLPLDIDLDPQNDTNDDTLLTNDIDNAGTFFQVSGTPLYLWFTSPLEQRDITVHARTPDGTLLTQLLSVLPAEYAKRRGLFANRVQIRTEEQGPKSLRFSPEFEEAGTPAIPLLFHWDFGDGTESIKEHPLHEYQTYGTYTVHLSIRSIETGLELASRTTAISLTAPLIQDPNTNLPPPALPPEPSTHPRTSFLRTALIILGIAIGFTAIGFLAAWAVHTVKRLLRKRKAETEDSPTPAPTTVPTLLPTAPTTSPTPNWLKKGPPPPPPEPPAPPQPKPSAPTPPQKPATPAPAPPPPPPGPSTPTPTIPPQKPNPPTYTTPLPAPVSPPKQPPVVQSPIAAPVPVLKAPPASRPPSPPAPPKIAPLPLPPPVPAAPVPPPPPPPKPPTALTVPTVPTLPTIPASPAGGPTVPPPPTTPSPSKETKDAPSSAQAEPVPPFGPDGLRPSNGSEVEGAGKKEEKEASNPTIAVVRAESLEQQKPVNPPKG